MCRVWQVAVSSLRYGQEIWLRKPAGSGFFVAGYLFMLLSSQAIGYGSLASIMGSPVPPSVVGIKNLILGAGSRWWNKKMWSSPPLTIQMETQLEGKGKNDKELYELEL